MFLFAFLSAAAVLAGADPDAVSPVVAASRAELYHPPIVRPFEPPSDFGAELAQGDADDTPRRRPLSAPVVVNAYLHSYEVSLSDGEVAYQQGVAQAEIDADARMGPLDGRWDVTARDGSPILNLVLTDPGVGEPVEGAWREPDAVDHLGPVASVERGNGAVAITLEDTSGALSLNLAADGAWTGVLTADGRSQPVEVRRPG